MSLGAYIRESLREKVLAESKSVEEWWDRLPGKRRLKVVAILGLSKGRAKVIYSKLNPDEQSEISAYFKKYKGKVEGTEGTDDTLNESMQRNEASLSRD